MHAPVQSLVHDGAFEPRTRKSAYKFDADDRGLRIALIVPRFSPSYYNNNYMLPLLPGDKRTDMPAGAFPVLASLVPPEHEVEIFDENIGPIDFARLKTFDLVGITGMIVQLDRMRVLLDRLSEFEGLLVVGGPYASVDQNFFTETCDVLFVGEAEATWPRFLEQVANGEDYDLIYEQDDRTDLTSLPTPRYDLLDSDRYRTASVQFSRGCPFLCEFCDIITIFGRVPRTKTPAQVIAELEALVREGFPAVFLVDDNFIGNKKLAKELLKELVVWQEENDYPLVFSTEASINLADEPELLDLMFKANFRSVFIGIESPSEEALTETRKVQNVRGDSLLAKIKRVRDSGLTIQGGFMVGFDSDGPDIFDRQFEFIQQAEIAWAGVAILTAIPSTPLYKRLEEEGRLRLDDINTNFAPAQMSSDDLRAGYLRLTEALYEPDNYFARVFGSWASSDKFRERWVERAPRMKMTLRRRLQAAAGAFVMFTRLTAALAKDGCLSHPGKAYLRIFSEYRKNGIPGISFARYVSYAVQHWHYYKFYRESRSGGVSVFNSYAYSDAKPVTKAASMKAA